MESVVRRLSRGMAPRFPCIGNVAPWDVECPIVYGKKMLQGWERRRVLELRFCGAVICSGWPQRCRGDCLCLRGRDRVWEEKGKRNATQVAGVLACPLECLGLSVLSDLRRALKFRMPTVQKFNLPLIKHSYYVSSKPLPLKQFLVCA